MRLLFSLTLMYLLATYSRGMADPIVKVDELKKNIEQTQRQIQEACSRSDYDTADQLYRKQLELLRTQGSDKTDLYAELLHEHGGVLRHLFNFAEAQKEETRAARIKHDLPIAHDAKSNQVMPPSPEAASQSSQAASVLKPPVNSAPRQDSRAKALSGAACVYGEGRYTVHTAIGDMDCHLMYDGKGLLRVMNEEDASTQFVIQYPKLTCRVLADEGVNKGQIFRSDYWPCDAPPFMDDRGALAAGAQFLGKRIIDGHQCSGWQSTYGDRGIHHFLCEMWFATDLRFPYTYTWSMKETPNNKVTWQMAVFTKTPKEWVFDLSGYKDSGKNWGGIPWLKWIAK